MQELQVSHGDLIFFFAGIGLAISTGSWCWWAGAIVWFVFGVHLLFSHIFRVSVALQAGWGVVFAFSAALTILKGEPGWSVTFGFNFAVAVALILLEKKTMDRFRDERVAPLEDGVGRLPARGRQRESGLSAVIAEVRRYDFVDALRGYAILAVIMVHSSLLLRPENTHLAQFMLFGVRGVDLFFVASALTLCLSWQHRASREIHPFRNFLVRRFFRIAPMFYVAMILYFALYGFSSRLLALNSVHWWHIPLTIGFLHGFTPESMNSVVPGGWSIAVEACFYLMLPALLLRLRSSGDIIVFFCASVSVSFLSAPVIRWVLADLCHYDQQGMISAFVGKNILAKLPVFAAGMVAWCVLRNRRRLRNVALAGMLLAAPLLYLECHITGSAPGEILLGSVHAGLIFALLAVVLGAYPPRLLVNRWICEIGQISYSMYLLHFIVVDLLDRMIWFHGGNLSAVLHFMVVTAVAAAVASQTRRWIELPGIEVGRRLIERLENRSR